MASMVSNPDSILACFSDWYGVIPWFSDA